jgi:PspA-Associated protein
VIVRILGLGQFRLDADDLPAVEAADDAVEAAVAAGDEQALRRALSDLIDIVVETGDPVPDQEFATSDVIVPPADSTLADLAGMGADGEEGLIPG